MIYNTAPLPSESSYTYIGVKNDKLENGSLQIPRMDPISAKFLGIQHLFC
jgi:hypothetical protein